jgi:hypothetical protein
LDKATGLLDNDTDLILLPGKNTTKYGLTVASNIFTPDELKENVIMDANRQTNRSVMDPVRVAVIQGKAFYTY